MYGILKKKYGQNFLIDKNILLKISNLISIKNLNIIEIGPGDGSLTDYILNFHPKKLTLVEVDSDLIPILNSRFNKSKNIKIINKDILRYELDKKVDLVISNLPYNISSQILVKLCLTKYLPGRLILMFQKEFGQRLLDKKLNSLNSLINCFYKVDTGFQVSKNCFRPIPRVESIVLSFTRKKNFLIDRNKVLEFIKFKQILFSQKRKTLNNTLKNFKFNKEEFDLSRRVEDISLNQLIKIFKNISF